MARVVGEITPPTEKKPIDRPTAVRKSRRRAASGWYWVTTSKLRVWKATTTAYTTSRILHGTATKLSHFNEPKPNTAVSIINRPSTIEAAAGDTCQPRLMPAILAKELPAMPLCTPNQPSSDTPTARPTTMRAPVLPKALAARVTVPAAGPPRPRFPGP